MDPERHILHKTSLSRVGDITYILKNIERNTRCRELGRIVYCM